MELGFLYAAVEGLWLRGGRYMYTWCGMEKIKLLVSVGFGAPGAPWYGWGVGRVMGMGIGRGLYLGS